MIDIVLYYGYEIEYNCSKIGEIFEKLTGIKYDDIITDTSERPLFVRKNKYQLHCTYEGRFIISIKFIVQSDVNRSDHCLHLLDIDGYMHPVEEVENFNKFLRETFSSKAKMSSMIVIDRY